MDNATADAVFAGLIASAGGNASILAGFHARYDPLRAAEGNFKGMSQVITDFVSCSGAFVARALSVRGMKSWRANNTVGFSRAQLPDDSPLGRATHDTDLYLLNNSTLLQPFTPAQTSTQAAMWAYLGAFFATGDPNAGAGGQPEWPAWSAGAPAALQFSDAGPEAVNPQPWDTQCDWQMGMQLDGYPMSPGGQPPLGRLHQD